MALVELDRCLLLVGKGQNHEKKEWLVRFVGKHACRKMRETFGLSTSLRGQPKLVTKYLGAWDDADGRTHVEVSKRVCAAAAAPSAFANWWRASLRYRVMVFKSVVLGSLLSGLEASVLTESDLARLERTQIKYLRAMAGQAACEHRCSFCCL